MPTGRGEPTRPCVDAEAVPSHAHALPTATGPGVRSGGSFTHLQDLRPRCCCTPCDDRAARPLTHAHACAHQPPPPPSHNPVSLDSVQSVLSQVAQDSAMDIIENERRHSEGSASDSDDESDDGYLDVDGSSTAGPAAAPALMGGGGGGAEVFSPPEPVAEPEPEPHDLYNSESESEPEPEPVLKPPLSSQGFLAGGSTAPQQPPTPTTFGNDPGVGAAVVRAPSASAAPPEAPSAPRPTAVPALSVEVPVISPPSPGRSSPPMPMATAPAPDSPFSSEDESDDEL